MNIKKINLQKYVQINFIDILWKILIQWRAILIFSIIIGLGITSLKYEKDIAAYKIAVDNAESKQLNTKLSKKEIAKLQNSLSDADLNTVNTAVFNQQKILTDQNYLDSSLLMNVDSQNEHVVYIDYFLSGAKPRLSELLCRSYSSRFYEDDVLENLADALDQDIDKANVQKVMGELIDVEYSGTTQSESTVEGRGYQLSTEVYPVITVSVILPADSDSSKIVDAVNSSVKSISKTLNKSIGSHKLNFLESYDKYMVDNDLKDKQNSVKNEILQSQSDNNTAIGSFSDDQKKLYDADVADLKEQMGITESGSEESPVSETPEKPSFSKKYLVIGFLTGFILYIFCYVVIVILRHRVNYGDDLADFTDLRKFGEFHRYDMSGLARFAYSRSIYNIYYRKFLKISEIADYAADGISAALSLTEDTAKSITLLSFEDTSESSKEFAETVADKLIDSGLTISQKDISIKKFLTDASAVKSLNQVILVLTQDSTTYSDLDDFLNMAEEYHIQVMGYLYAE